MRTRSPREDVAVALAEDAVVGSWVGEPGGEACDLDRDRRTNWGERLPTRTIIRIMIAHDLYHAGEINHLRTLLQGTDRWAYD